MESVTGWMFQRSANKQLASVTKGFDDMANDVQSSLSRMWNSAVGISQVPLVTVLEEFELPKGIFPKNVSKYTLERNEKSNESEGTLIVTMPFVCEVKYSDGHLIRYNKEIRCSIRKGRLEAIDGIKSKGIFWADVLEIIMKPLSDKIYFQCATRKSKVSINYENPREGVEVGDY